MMGLIKTGNRWETAGGPPVPRSIIVPSEIIRTLLIDVRINFYFCNETELSFSTFPNYASRINLSTNTEEEKHQIGAAS